MLSHEVCVSHQKHIPSEAELHWYHFGLAKRLIVHNSGGSVHTSKFKSWELVTYVGFSNASKALEFERYLKTGSGRAFAKKRL